MPALIGVAYDIPNLCWPTCDIVSSKFGCWKMRFTFVTQLTAAPSLLGASSCDGLHWLCAIMRVFVLVVTRVEGLIGWILWSYPEGAMSFSTSLVTSLVRWMSICRAEPMTQAASSKIWFWPEAAKTDRRSCCIRLSLVDDYRTLATEGFRSGSGPLDVLLRFRADELST